MVNKKKFTILLLILLALSLGAIFILYNLNKQTANKKTQAIQQNLNINKIEAAFDKPFYVELLMNPSTGFQWQAAFDAKVLKLSKTDFVQPADLDKVGTEEIQKFEFQALEKVNTSVTFRYVRPWETNTPPAETKTYYITLQ